MPKRLKDKKHTKKKGTTPKRPSSDPMVRTRQMMSEHMEKADAGKTWWDKDAPQTLRHAPSEDPPAPLPPMDQVRAFMSAMGRKGGKVSGARRMTNLSAKKRKEIAKKAAAARWGKQEP